MEKCIKLARHYIQEIPRKIDYDALMDSANLTDVERAVCDYKYRKGWSLIQIGEEFGYSESGVKRIHLRALKKLEKVI